MGPKSLRKIANILAASLLLSPLVLAACTGSETSHLLVTQSTDAPAGADHKSHVSPGVFTGITLSIRNPGAGAARGEVVEHVLPDRLHHYELTTLRGNAIRPATCDRGPTGNPTSGAWPRASSPARRRATKATGCGWRPPIHRRTASSRSGRRGIFRGPAMGKRAWCGSRSRPGSCPPWHPGYTT